MGIQDLISLLKRLGISSTIYPLSLPTGAPAECILVETGDGADSRGDVTDFILTLTVRATHPARSEKLALEILDTLKNVTSEQVGDTDIILIRSQQKLPQYLGKDENDYHYHETNFIVLAS